MFVELKDYALFDVKIIENCQIIMKMFQNLSQKPLSAKYIYEKGIYRGTNTGDNSKI